jgi:hypothetical protein
MHALLKLLRGLEIYGKVIVAGRMHERHRGWADRQVSTSDPPLLTKKEVEGVAVSIERLDRSEEALDLKKAAWARFIAVVGKIVLLGTLLFVGLFVYMIYVQKHLPNTTTLIVFYATLGFLSFGYVVHQNLPLLRWVWKHPLGKVFFGLVASVTVTVCKVLTDQQIRSLTQSNPSLLPSAQQAITVLNIIVITIAGVCISLVILMSANFMWRYIRYVLLDGILEWFLLFWNVSLLRSRKSSIRSRPSSARSMTSLVAYWWAVGFSASILSFVGLDADFAGTRFAGFGGKTFNLTDVLLRWSSFIPNDISGSDRVCMNLPSDTLVCPFNTRDAIPDQVLMAQPISTDPDRSGRNYTYQVVACSKPIHPGALSSARTDISPDQKSGDTSTGSSR